MPLVRFRLAGRAQPKIDVTDHVELSRLGSSPWLEWNFCLHIWHSIKDVSDKTNINNLFLKVDAVTITYSHRYQPNHKFRLMSTSPNKEMPDISILVLAVAGPMTKVLSVCVTGYICALPRVGLLGSATRSALSRLNVNIFLPPFLFTTLSKSIDLSALLIWWPIPLFVVFNIIFGVLLGFALVYALGALGQRTREHRGLILAACACGNVRGLSFSLLCTFS